MNEARPAVLGGGPPRRPSRPLGALRCVVGSLAAHGAALAALGAAIALGERGDLEGKPLLVRFDGGERTDPMPREEPETVESAVPEVDLDKPPPEDEPEEEIESPPPLAETLFPDPPRHSRVDLPDRFLVTTRLPAPPEPPPVERPPPPAPPPPALPPRVANEPAIDPERSPPPRYPESARRLGIEGRLVVHVRVAADGRVEAARVHESSGFPILDEEAAAAVLRWRFRPALDAEGRPLPGETLVPIRFALER